MQNKIITILGAALLLSIGIIIGRKSVDDKSGALFVNGSDKYLNEIQLDLPEEISTITQDTDSTIDLLSGYLDAKAGVIYLGFTGLQLPKAEMQYVNEEPCLVRPFYQQHPCKPDMHEYQLELEMDSLSLFDHGRFVGKVKYGNSPLDSLFMVDNQ